MGWRDLRVCTELRLPYQEAWRVWSVSHVLPAQRQPALPGLNNGMSGAKSGLILGSAMICPSPKPATHSSHRGKRGRNVGSSPTMVSGPQPSSQLFL